MANSSIFRGISRDGRRYDDDVVFERERGERPKLEGVHHGRGARDREHDRESNSSHSGQRDSMQLTLVDNRTMVAPDNREPRRYEKQRDPTEGKWTEITRDLVSEEAIKERGYEFEASRDNFYVMKYLRYVSPAPTWPTSGAAVC